MGLIKFFRRRKRKNPFEGSLIIDNPDIKVVEAKYNKKPFLFAVGTSKQRELKISGKGNAEGMGAKYQTQKDLDWQVLYNPKVLPEFIPIEKAKNLMAGTVAVTSGSIDVFSPDTKYREDIDLDRFERIEHDRSERIEQMSEKWRKAMQDINGENKEEKKKGD